MILSNFVFYKQYFNSPISKIHLINAKAKIYLTIYLLKILPYLYDIYIIYTIFLLILFIYMYLFIRTYSINTTSFKRQFILTLIQITYYLYSYVTFIDSTNQKYVKLIFCMPFTIKFIKWNINYILGVCIIKYKTYLFPYLIIKIIALKIIHSMLLNILFNTTTYELIMIFFFNILKKNFCQILSYHNFLVILSFTVQFLERIIYNLNGIILSINLKYNKNIHKKYSVFISLQIIKEYYANIIKDIYHITYCLWHRDINN